MYLKLEIDWVDLVESGREFHNFIVAGKNELAKDEVQTKGCDKLKAEKFFFSENSGFGG